MRKEREKNKRQVRQKKKRERQADNPQKRMKA